MVAGRQADRLSQQAGASRAGSHRERGPLGGGGARRARSRGRSTSTPEGESGRPQWSPDGARIAVLLGDIDRTRRLRPEQAGARSVQPAAARRRRAILTRRSIARSRTRRGRLGRRAPSRSCWRTTARSRSPPSPPRVARCARLTETRRVVSNINPGRATAASRCQTLTPTMPPEISAFEQRPGRGRLHEPGRCALTTHNEALLRRAAAGDDRGFQSRSKDGTEVHGLIVKPAGYERGAQISDDPLHSRRAQRAGRARLQLPARVPGRQGLCRAGGELSRQRRPRQGVPEGDLRATGATSRSSICSARSTKRSGRASPIRIGWASAAGATAASRPTTRSPPTSASRRRSAAPAARCSSRCTGTDQYIVQYDQEMGQPWKAKDAWMKVSYPFFNAERIKTPTLFLGGEKDFNVPIAGGEQMYQALKSLGVDDATGDLSRPVPRPDDPELRARPAAALPRLVQQAPEAGGCAYGAAVGLVGLVRLWRQTFRFA